MSPAIPVVNGTVYAITVYDERLIIGGSFTVVGGVAANNIAYGTVYIGGLWVRYRWDVRTLTVYDGKLIAGESSRRRVGRARVTSLPGRFYLSPLGSGMEGTDPYVYALTVYNGNLIAGAFLPRRVDERE